MKRFLLLAQKGWLEAQFADHYTKMVMELKMAAKVLQTTRSELDLLDVNAVREWFQLQKPTIVIIAAAKVGGILANSQYPTQFLLDNLKIQNNLIENAWQTGVKRLLFLGSSCILP